MSENCPYCQQLVGIEETLEEMDPPDQSMIMLEYEIHKMELEDTEEEAEGCPDCREPMDIEETLEETDPPNQTMILLEY